MAVDVQCLFDRLAAIYLGGMTAVCEVALQDSCIDLKYTPYTVVNWIELGYKVNLTSGYFKLYSVAIHLSTLCKIL